FRLTHVLVDDTENHEAATENSHQQQHDRRRKSDHPGRDLMLLEDRHVRTLERPARVFLQYWLHDFSYEHIFRYVRKLDASGRDLRPIPASPVQPDGWARPCRFSPPVILHPANGRRVTAPDLPGALSRGQMYQGGVVTSLGGFERKKHTGPTNQRL